MSNLDQEHYGFEGSKNLKQKILARQKELNILQVKIEENRVDTLKMESHQEEISNMLAKKCDFMKESIEEKFKIIEADMKKHFAHQKAESSRLQSQLTTLKGQESLLNGQLQGLMQRLKRLKTQVGNVEV